MFLEILGRCLLILSCPNEVTLQLMPLRTYNLCPKWKKKKSDHTSPPPLPSPDCWNGLPEDSSRNSASSREITMGFARLGVWDPGKSHSGGKSESRSGVSDSLGSHGLYSPQNSPGQNTGVGSLSLLHGIFLTQESYWDLLHCRWILYQLSYQGGTQGRHQLNNN